jgi:beta-carotene 15,15'-dioxygenase
MNQLKISIYKLIETPTLISILLGSFLLLLQIIKGEIPINLQCAFFAFFIFLTGIPHGAIDHLVEQKTAEKNQKSFNLAFFSARYVLTMAFYGLMWFALPSLSLLFFLLISAWHFGETDIENAPIKPLWNTTRFVFGCFVLLFILLFHSAETTPILARISQNNSTVLLIWNQLINSKLMILMSTFISTLILFYLANKNDLITFNKSRYFRLFLILLLTYFLPLLPAFALYFGGWHALCSFDSIHNYLSNNSENNSENQPAFSILKTWSKTLSFSLLAFASLAFATWYWLHFLQTFDPLPLLFIFLSLITLPHLNVMHKMN